MRWATRKHCHVDRAACAWLIRRLIDAEAEFVFVNDPADYPATRPPSTCGAPNIATITATAASRRFLRHYELDDPALWEIAEIVHEADLEDERYDAPEARGLDVLLRGSP